MAADRQTEKVGKALSSSPDPKNVGGIVKAWDSGGGVVGEGMREGWRYSYTGQQLWEVAQCPAPSVGLGGPEP